MFNDQRLPDDEELRVRKTGPTRKPTKRDVAVDLESEPVPEQGEKIRRSLGTLAAEIDEFELRRR